MSKSLKKEWKKCGTKSLYAVGVDTLNSIAIHFAFCLDGNRFNATLRPVSEKGGTIRYYSGNYTSFNDTIILAFDRQHIPEFLGNRMFYGADKKNIFWIRKKDDEHIKLSIMKPGMRYKRKIGWEQKRMQN